jgi:Mrp family chromosome partitioning ATPase
MAKALDGVVLVVEAERTRAAAVQATQRTIKMHGGNVLGVVLNKCRYMPHEYGY